MATQAVIVKNEKALREPAKQASVETFPWERCAGETSQAYARFLCYRTMPASERGIRKVGVSMQLAARWSKRWNWVKRAQAYDDHLAELSDQIGERAVLQHRAALARLGSVSIAKAQSSVLKLDETKQTASDIAQIAKIGLTSIQAAFGSADARPGNQTIIATQVNYGETEPSWRQSKQNEIDIKPVVNMSEQVLAETGGRTVRRLGTKRVPQLPDSQPKTKPARQVLKERVVEAPKRRDDDD